MPLPASCRHPRPGCLCFRGIGRLFASSRPHTLSLSLDARAAAGMSLRQLGLQCVRSSWHPSMSQCRGKKRRLPVQTSSDVVGLRHIAIEACEQSSKERNHSCRASGALPQDRQPISELLGWLGQSWGSPPSRPLIVAITKSDPVDSWVAGRQDKQSCVPPPARTHTCNRIGRQKKTLDWTPGAPERMSPSQLVANS